MHSANESSTGIIPFLYTTGHLIHMLIVQGSACNWPLDVWVPDEMWGNFDLGILLPWWWGFPWFPWTTRTPVHSWACHFPPPAGLWEQRHHPHNSTGDYHSQHQHWPPPYLNYTLWANTSIAHHHNLRIPVAPSQHFRNSGDIPCKRTQDLNTHNHVFNLGISLSLVRALRMMLENFDIS